LVLPWSGPEFPCNTGRTRREAITLEDVDQGKGATVLSYRGSSDLIVLEEDRGESYASPGHDRQFFRGLR
jgi:hypothetical protein